MKCIDLASDKIVMTASNVCFLSLFLALYTGDKIAKRNVSWGQKSRAEEARGSTICAAVQTVRTAKILPRHPFLKYPESSGILMSRHGGTVNVHTRVHRRPARVINGARNILTRFSRCVSSSSCDLEHSLRHQIGVIRPFCNFHRKRPSRIPRRV